MKTGCGFLVDALAFLGSVAVAVLFGWMLYRVQKFIQVLRAVVRELYPKGYKASSYYGPATRSELTYVRDGLDYKAHKTDYEYLSKEVYRLRDVVEKKKAKKP